MTDEERRLAVARAIRDAGADELLDVNSEMWTNFMGAPEDWLLEADAAIAVMAENPPEPATITVDLTTSEWVTGGSITADQGYVVAASVLPGVTPQDVSGWYATWLGAHP